jgi:hypothetical protein
MELLRSDHGTMVKTNHDDLMEVRMALRGAEGAVSAAVNAVERWRQR